MPKGDVGYSRMTLAGKCQNPRGDVGGRPYARDFGLETSANSNTKSNNNG